jgi:hypothetical protein
MSDEITVRARLLPSKCPYVALVVCGARTAAEAAQAHGVPWVGRDCDALKVTMLQEDVWEVRIEKKDLRTKGWYWALEVVE